MNVLAISLDPNILEPHPARRTNNARERQLAYARRLDSYHVIVLTRGAARRSAERAAENCWLYPACGPTRLHAGLHAGRWAAAICQRTAIDVVTTQDPWGAGLVGLRVARRHRLPLNVQMHADIFENGDWLQERWLHRWLHPLAVAVLRRAKTIRTVTERSRDWLISRGMSAQRIRTIPVAIELPRACQQFPAAGPGRWVVFAGRLVPQKNLQTLLDAVPLVVRQCPDVTFVLCGDGPMASSMARAQARNRVLERSVRLEGAVSHERMAAYWHRADVAVLSSVYEGLPQVLLEAASLGRPIVATATPGACEIVEDGRTGFLVPPRNATALAARVIQLLEQPALASAMGRAGRERVAERFGHRDLIGEMVELLAQTAR